MGRQGKTIRNKRKIKVDYNNYTTIDDERINRTISKAITRETKMTIISIFIVTIVMISSAFAIFSSVQRSNDYNTLTVGVLKVDFEKGNSNLGNVINLNGAFPSADEEGLKTEPYSFSIVNSGTLNAKYNVKIVDDLDMIETDMCNDKLLSKGYVKISINNEPPFILQTKDSNGFIVKDGVLRAGESKNFSIRIWIDQNAGNDSLGKHYHGKIVVESENKNANDNIRAAYEYNNDTCITGEEETCVRSDCYKSSNINACQVGTIIRYAITNNEEKYFYVLKDEGKTMTLQQRENTTNNVEWYANSEDNSKGPLTALESLEPVTSSWSNVNNISYTMGTTTFGNNSFTGCGGPSSCLINTYITEQKSAKARMITVQELADLGCTGANQSCPIWISNSPGYWTMSAYSTSTNQAWVVNSSRAISYNPTNNNGYGTRAVIEVNK